MPSFEKLFDELRDDLATTPEEKAYNKGYKDGRSYARKEIFWMVVGIIFFKCLMIFLIF